MKRFASIRTTAATSIVALAFIGSAGIASAAAAPPPAAVAASAQIAAGPVAVTAKGRAPAAYCGGFISGSPGRAPSKVSPLGVAGTTSQDIALFARTMNSIRVANCLPPIPLGNFRYDTCMEARLFWMAESPSLDPLDAWGHMGSVRIDGVPSTGCDGNLAGGYDNTAATVAQKWWASSGHRTSLYRPAHLTSTANVCILFAMTHGGVPNEPYAFARAAARWITC